MEIFNSSVESMLENIKYAKEYVDADSLREFENIIINSENIFLVGAGRSSLVAKAFAMRLISIGKSVYVVGEITIPSIREKDCLVAISGSGETNNVVSAANIALMKGSKVLSITSFPDSTLGKMSDSLIIVKGRERNYEDDGNYIKRQIYGNSYSDSPLGTIFELTTLVFLDAITNELINR